MTERVQELIKAFNAQTNAPGYRGEAILRMVAGLDVSRPRIAEIGVFSGALSEWILRMIPAAELLMVDKWQVCSPTDDVTTPLAQEEWDIIRATATDRVRRFGDRACVLAMPSVDAAKDVADGSIDVVFIDGDHTLEGCSSDIAAWWPKVRSGGYISGHDWGYPHIDIGVEPAVRQFCARVHLPIRVLLSDFVWVVRKG